MLTAKTLQKMAPPGLHPKGIRSLRLPLAGHLWWRLWKLGKLRLLAESTV